MSAERKTIVIKAADRATISPRPHERTLVELKKIKDELLTLARRVDKTIEEVEAA